MLRLRPRPTLFPYTTLFRSHARPAGLRQNRLQRPVDRFRRRQRHGDRKSTRLNSSHEWISYAVFCLKKKKKHENDLPTVTTTPTTLVETGHRANIDVHVTCV